jgi:hypothetical protein
VPGELETKLKRIIALSFLLMIGQCVAQKKDVNGEQKAKSTKISEMQVDGDSMTAVGVWRADELNEGTELAIDQVTRLECYKTGGQRLVGSESYCMEATAVIIASGFPEIKVAYIPVRSWSEELIIAGRSPTNSTAVCTWEQISISLREHSVILTETRKVGDGSKAFQDSCGELPLVRTFHLVDRLGEFARRLKRASDQRKQK